ncbi:MAG TPA: hypothetical protein VHJ38_02020 [Nitrososphaeraceae archaeon]|nr:hypothetical protein [Nitrososphaeraceae archaeon]
MRKENNLTSTTKHPYRRIMLVNEELGLLIPVKLGLEGHSFIVDTFSTSLEALASSNPNYTI